jgi:hypothetical protein
MFCKFILIKVKKDAPRENTGGKRMKKVRLMQQ